MHQLYWVIPGLLAGRCGPDKVPWDPKELYEAGIRTIVTVASEVPVADLASFGILHRRVPMAPLPFLSRWGQRRLVRRAKSILPFIYEQIQAGRPVLIHCHDGDDRTGVVLSGYLVTYGGLSPDEAVARVRAANPRAMKMPGYARAVRWFADETSHGKEEDRDKRDHHQSR